MAAIDRVLLIHDYSGLGGGAEVVVHGVRDRLRARGVDARLLSSTADQALPGAEPEYSYAGGTGRLRALREVANPSAGFALRRALREFNPQGIYLSMFLTQASPLILRQLDRRRVIWAPNEYRAICPSGTRLLPSGVSCQDRPGVACLRNGCFRPWGLAPRMMQLSLLAQSMHVVDRTLVPSRAFGRTLERFGVRVTGVLAPPLPLPVGSRKRHPTPIVAVAGRLVPEKGVHVAIEAFARVLPQFPAARLWIAGDGPERQRLEALTRTLSVQANVDFLGHVPRPTLEERLEAAWVQCVPSIWDEPFGLVAIEAQARGTAVVVSHAGALPEIVTDGDTGYVVPPGDAGSLAAALEFLLANPALADECGDRARRSAFDRYHPDSYASRLLEEFEDIGRDTD